MTLKKYFLAEKRLNLMIILFIGVTILISTYKQVALINLADSLINFSQDKFLFWISVMVVITLFNVLTANWTDFFETLGIQKMNLSLRADLANGIINQTYDEFNLGTTGKYTSWLNNDVETIDQKGFQVIYNFAMYLAGIIFPLISFLSFHWSLTVVSAAISIIVTFLPRIIQKHIESSSKKLTLTNERFVHQIENVLNGFETLTSFGRKKEIVRQVRIGSEEVKSASMAYKKNEVQVDVIANLISGFGQLVIIALTGFLILRHEVSPGKLVGVSQLASSIFISLAQLSGLMVRIKAVRPIFAKYKDLSIVPKADEVMIIHGGDPSLTISKLTSFEDNHVWLSPISAKINWPAKVQITGASGHGKSTLLRILAGITDHYEGKYRWQTFPGKPIAQPIYVPQRPYIFNQTIRYNITLGRDFSDSEILQVIEMVGLTTIINQLKAGLDTIISTNGADFSGGQRQRIALARALILNPDILLLDESTSSVDDATAKKIEAEILANNHQLLLLVSHHQFTENNHLFTQEIKL